MVDEHIEKKTLTEIEVTPKHGKRNTTAFHKSVKRLQDDGHYFCSHCGVKEKIEVHHLHEFSLENICDFDKLKEYLITHDEYGYSKLMIDEQITTVDDVRNLLCLCKPHHTGKGTGIHELEYAVWLAQRTCKKGEDPIPQKDETIQQVEDRIAEVNDGE